MQLQNDDITAEVSNEYLGPKGWQFWWTARYSAYGIGFVLFVVALGIETKIGVHLGLWPLVFTLLAVVLVTRKIGTVTSYETPFRTVMVVFWHEITAPRQTQPRRPADMRPRAVTVRPAPRPYWLRRPKDRT